jgi:hypothetical protein
MILGMRAGGPDARIMIRAIWIIIAILAALILALIILQAYFRNEKPSPSDNREGGAEALCICKLARHLINSAEVPPTPNWKDLYDHAGRSTCKKSDDTRTQVQS